MVANVIRIVPTGRIARKSSARLLAAAAVAIALSVPWTGQAAASTNDVGRLLNTGGQCLATRVWANAPGIQPSTSYDTFSGKRQVIGFFSVLERYDFASGTWRPVQYGDFYYGIASYVNLDGDLFYNTTTRQSDAGTAIFSMAGRTGYFRVRQDAFWFTDGMVTGRASQVVLLAYMWAGSQIQWAYGSYCLYA